MNKKMLSALVVAAFLAVPTAELTGQVMQRESQPGMDVFSINVNGGGFFPLSTLGGDNEFDDAGSVGGALTYWFHNNAGVRANFLWASTDFVGLEDSPLQGEDPDVYHYSGDVLLRLPLPGPEVVDSWFPYIVGGIGGKTYDFQTLTTDTDVTGNFGVGVEFRFGEMSRWGINTEVRDFVSNFDRQGIDRTQNDLVWTGGLTLNF